MNELLETTARRNIALVISAVRPNVCELMDQAGFTEALGAENFCNDIFIALDRAKELMTLKSTSHVRQNRSLMRWKISRAKAQKHKALSRF